MLKEMVRNDLALNRDRHARARGAVNILENLGYVVHLEKRRGPPPKPAQPPLKLVE